MSLIEEVRAAVSTIPSGRVSTYGDIARALGVGPRQVGRAMSELAGDFPWWRVVYADGTPAACHDGSAPELLRREDTPMRGSRVDLPNARHRFTVDSPVSPPVRRPPHGDTSRG